MENGLAKDVIENIDDQDNETFNTKDPQNQKQEGTNTISTAEVIQNFFNGNPARFIV